MDGACSAARHALTAPAQPPSSLAPSSPLLQLALKDNTVLAQAQRALSAAGEQQLAIQVCLPGRRLNPSMPVSTTSTAATPPGTHTFDLTPILPVCRCRRCLRPRKQLSLVETLFQRCLRATA